MGRRRGLNVRIAGAASTAFGKSGRGLRDLAGEAARGAMADAGVEPGDIDAVYVGCFSPANFCNQEHVGPLVAEAAGVTGVPATRLEGACASGSLAVAAATHAIEARAHRTVLVVGVEAMTGLAGPFVTRALAMAGDWEKEGRHGLSFPGVFAMMARCHMAQHGTTREQLAAVAVKAHENALTNPKAHFHRRISFDDVVSARTVADPLTVLDCAPVSDGAAAMVLSGVDGPSGPHDVRLAAVAQASDTLSVLARADLTSFAATRRAAADAYATTGLAPADVDLVEVHDCFTIAEIIAIEDLGFFRPGEGGPAVLEQRTSVEGDLPVNVGGGLKAKGHPVGATGVAQLVDSALRLRGADERFPNAEVALTHNVGGSGATAVVSVLMREG